MKYSTLAFGSPPTTARRFASIAKLGVAAALALFGLAILAGGLGLDRDGAIGTVIFPTLGVLTLLGGVGAFLAGIIAIFREHDRSVGTILATVAGALVGWFMIVEMFIEG
jgi:hypothetical protein